MYKQYENNIESDPFATARDTPPPPPPHWTKNSFVTFKKGMGFIKKNSHGWVFCNQKCLFLLKTKNSY